jgi:hypothetical protein
VLVSIDCAQDKERALRNGGKIIGEYPDGWMVQVRAERIGDISYRLPDGSVIRRYRRPVRYGQGPV